MLSYRHAFHAGNHADILKHTTLTLVLASLLRKDKPFTVFDTHGGAGIYNMSDPRVEQTGEARSGITRLLEYTNQVPAPEPMEQYISLCRSYSCLGLYPGSPEIERMLMREQDKLFVAELHNTEIKILQENMAGPPLIGSGISTPRTRVLHMNGFEMLQSYLPPKIRRGAILMDPSYETNDDYVNTANSLRMALAKWNTAIIVLWYPLLHHRRNEIDNIKETLSAVTRVKVKDSPDFCAELHITSQSETSLHQTRLYGSGMLILNPPYMLEQQMEECLPFLAKTLDNENGSWCITRL